MLLLVYLFVTQIDLFDMIGRDRINRPRSRLDDRLRRVNDARLDIGHWNQCATAANVTYIRSYILFHE